MDSVVRTVYYKYLYPKEVFISNGILQVTRGGGGGQSAEGEEEGRGTHTVFARVSLVFHSCLFHSCFPRVSVPST